MTSPAWPENDSGPVTGLISEHKLYPQAGQQGEEEEAAWSLPGPCPGALRKGVLTPSSPVWTSRLWHMGREAGRGGKCLIDFHSSCRPAGGMSRSGRLLKACHGTIIASRAVWDPRSLLASKSEGRLEAVLIASVVGVGEVPGWVLIFQCLGELYSRAIHVRSQGVQTAPFLRVSVQL